MSIELITGRAGKPHVDSQDVRAYQAYTAGSGRYVLHGAACSVESANQVSIAPGEILVDGTHVRVTGDGETVTLANGQTGYKRADIVALHYTVTGSGGSIVESMEFAVVQGSPSDTDPADPDMPQSGSILDGVTETYIPYARVVIDGLSPQEPEMLVEQYALPSGMGGIPSGGDLGSFLAKASAADHDTEWKTALESLDLLGINPLVIDRGGTGATSVAGAVAALGLTSIKSNAPYVRSINPSTLKVKTGSTVVTFKSSYGTLFTPSQMTSLLGRAFNQTTDAVLVMNGDNSAKLGFLVSAASHSDGHTQIYAKYWGLNDKDAAGPFRVNWVVVYR